MCKDSVSDESDSIQKKPDDHWSTGLLRKLES